VDALDDVVAALFGELRMFSRTAVPSTLGVMPTSLLRIAFSMAPSTLRSQGWITIWCGSGTLIPASWLSGVDVP